MLRKRGIRATSITEHADDSPNGKSMEAIIESVGEFYSENLGSVVLTFLTGGTEHSDVPAVVFGYYIVQLVDCLRKGSICIEVD